MQKPMSEMERIDAIFIDIYLFIYLFFNLLLVCLLICQNVLPFHFMGISVLDLDLLVSAKTRLWIWFIKLIT